MPKPVTIGLIGLSDVGKTATITALFRSQPMVGGDLARQHTLYGVDLCIPDGGNRPAIRLRVIDTPGIETTAPAGKKFAEVYHAALKQCDVILWVIAAHQPALGSVQAQLRRLPPHLFPRMVFGINQVDRVAPLDWNELYQIPSLRQEERIKAISARASAAIFAVTQRDPFCICYSALRGYRLELLFHALLERCSDDRQAATAAFKAVSHRDLTTIEES
jgi:predicted GTPase